MGDGADPVDGWWRQWLLRPAELPSGLQPVQGRLVRQVGRGRLGDCAVFVKLMGFPRGKDRLRYLLRPLPARHEARMLAAVGALGIACPRVVAVRTARVAGVLPRASMLVLEALPVATGSAAPADELQQRAALALALLRGGIRHPDLNAGNFVRLQDGRLAVLDLQSARRRRETGRGPAIAAAARLLRDVSGQLADAEAAAALLRSGLLADAAEVAAARARAAFDQHRWLRSRILRCLTNSTEFRVEWRPAGRWSRRRHAADPGRELQGGRELIDCWLGDRALEVMEGRKPSLVALFRSWPWLPGRVSAYIAPSYDAIDIRSELMVLQEGFLKYRWLLDGRYRTSAVVRA